MNPAFLIAALASTLYGSADFSGGIAARRAPAPLVTMFSGFAAIAVLLVGLLFVHGAPSRVDLGWAAAAGLAGAAGAALIYYSLALGPVSVASPIFCVVGLSVPVLIGFVLGERPTAWAWSGVALAVVAIPPLSWTDEARSSYPPAHVRRTVLIAILTGLVVGWFLVFLARIGPRAGLMPLLLARVVAMLALAALLLARGRSLRIPSGARRVASLAGALDSAANLAYFLAVQRAPMALVATLVSLAPATTVLLARLTLGERWTAPQRWGLGLALAAGALISRG